MIEPGRISIPVKIAVAAAVILLMTIGIMVVFGSREWNGLETLITASMLVPLSALFWPFFETGGYIVLFGIDYARQAIWRRRQKELAKALEDIAKAREEGYRLGYDARVAEENGSNDGNGPSPRYGDADDHR